MTRFEVQTLNYETVEQVKSAADSHYSTYKHADGDIVLDVEMNPVTRRVVQRFDGVHQISEVDTYIRKSKSRPAQAKETTTPNGGSGSGDESGSLNTATIAAVGFVAWKLLG